LANREMREYELNEVGWWGKWVDETTWVSKNGYAIFSDSFKQEAFFNRGGFVGVEKVPQDAVEAIEREFAKRGRKVPSIFVEDGRQWDKMRSCLASRGYAVADRMLVMEGVEEPTSGPNPKVAVDLVGPTPRRNELQQWTRTYLEAFYGDQKLNGAVSRIIQKAAKDKKVSLFLGRVGDEPAGCAAMYRSAGGVAGAYCIGTIPRFRGRRVGAAIVRRVREIARDEKRKLILQTLFSDRVERFYVKQGFKQVYLKSLFELPRNRSLVEKDVPSGETFGVRFNRDAVAVPATPFQEVFEGFEKLDAVRRLFGTDAQEVIAKLKVMMDSPVGYLRVDGDTGDIIINPEYLRTGDERHLYLDVLHELTHVRQFKEGKELYDRRYPYFERPTEIEAYEVAVEEARRIGMSEEEIVEYLRVDWVTEEEFLRFVSKMKVRKG